MQTPPSTERNSSRDRSPAWGALLRGALETDETYWAWFEADLNGQAHFERQAIVVTNRRVLICKLSAALSLGKPAISNVSIVNQWPHAEVASLKQRELGAAGAIEVRGQDRLLAVVRFTRSKATAAGRFAQRASAMLASDEASLQELETTVCPNCGAVLGPDDASCPNCGEAAEAVSAKSLFRLWRFAKNRWWNIVLAIVMALLSTQMTLFSTYVTIPLFDKELVPAQQPGGTLNTSNVTMYLVTFFFLAVLGWLFNWYKTYVMAMASEYMSADLRNATYRHLQSLSLDYFGSKRTGDLISRINNDTDRINYFLSVHLAEFITSFVFMLQAAVLMLCLNFWLALAALIPFPIIAYIIQVVRERMRHTFALSGKTWSELLSVLADTIPGVRVVKAFAQENREIKRFEEANNHIIDAAIRVNRIWSFFTPTITLLTELGKLIVWGYAAWQIANHGVTIGQLSAFLLLIGNFYAQLDWLSRMLGSVQRSAASTQRIFEILDKVPSVPEPKSPVRPGRLEGRIEICGVRFSYGTREVIKGVNLVIEPGEMIGLVGPSGAGKSTLVNLACRFYDVSAGAILVDGVDIRSFPTIDYRSNIGIVLQEPYLFYGTIAENIAYGRPDATRRDIINAAKSAKAHEFILKLPDGYDSIVGERGQSLSGGERQRISIARALLTDPRILILDEATSAVDTQTERDIQEALDNLTRGRTTIAIAHRLSTLRQASRIVVMEHGSIVESGPPQELLARDGPFARLHQAQLDLSTGNAR